MSDMTVGTLRAIFAEQGAAQLIAKITQLQSLMERTAAKATEMGAAAEKASTASAAASSKAATAAAAAGSRVEDSSKRQTKAAQDTEKAATAAGNASAAAGEKAVEAGASEAAAAEKATKSTSTLTATVTKHKDALNTIAGVALKTGAIGVAAVGVAVASTITFGKAMSDVQANTHASSAEIKKLSDVAVDYSTKSVFSATQVAEAENELAKAGLTTSQIMGGGLEGALNLAHAGNLDVATSAEIAASAMNQFGLGASDTSHIADLLAAGADKAQGSVQDLGEALTYVGPTAHGMGISIEETTGALTLFASRGITGSEAGTQLRGILSSLTGPSKVAADEMKSLGINLYDAQGHFIGIDGAAQQLHDHMSGLSESQRNAALATIFGNQQLSGAQILYQGGAADVDKYTKAVNDNGFAAQQSHTKLNNLWGDLKKLSSTVNADFIKSGSGVNDVMRDAVQWATKVANALGKIPAPALETGVKVAAIGGASLIVVGALMKLITAVASFKTACSDLGLGPRAAIDSIKKGFEGINVEPLNGVGAAAEGSTTKLEGTAAAETAVGTEGEVAGAKAQAGMTKPGTAAMASTGKVDSLAASETAVGTSAEAAGATAATSLDGVGAKAEVQKGKISSLLTSVNLLGLAFTAMAQADEAANDAMNKRTNDASKAAKKAGKKDSTGKSIVKDSVSNGGKDVLGNESMDFSSFNIEGIKNFTAAIRLASESQSKLRKESSETQAMFGAKWKDDLSALDKSFSTLGSTSMPKASAAFVKVADSYGLNRTKMLQLIDSMPGYKKELETQITSQGKKVNSDTLLQAALGKTYGQYSQLQSMANINKDLKITGLDTATYKVGDLSLKIKALPDGNLQIKGNNKDAMKALAEVTGAKIDPKTGTLDLNKAQYDVAMALANGAKIDPKTGLMYGDNSQYWQSIAASNGWKIDPKTGELLGDNGPIKGTVGETNGLKLDPKTGYFYANPDSYHATKSAVEGEKIKDKDVAINAHKGAGWDIDAWVHDITVKVKGMFSAAFGSANGNYFPAVNAFAQGGESHIAQIARPMAPYRIWAEPETGGEAYIPLAASKRARSTAILSRVADEFNMALIPLHRFADGGVEQTRMVTTAVAAPVGQLGDAGQFFNVQGALVEVRTTGGNAAVIGQSIASNMNMRIRRRTQRGVSL